MIATNIVNGMLIENEQNYLFSSVHFVQTVQVSSFPASYGGQRWDELFISTCIMLPAAASDSSDAAVSSSVVNPSSISSWVHVCVEGLLWLWISLKCSYTNEIGEHSAVYTIY